MATSSRHRLQWDSATLFRIEIKGEGDDDVDKMERTPLLNALEYASREEVGRCYPLVRTMLATLETALKQSVEKWNEICGEDDDMHFTPTWTQQRGSKGRTLRATRPVNYNDKHDRFQLECRLDSYNNDGPKKKKPVAKKAKKAKTANKRKSQREASSEESFVSSDGSTCDRSHKKGRSCRPLVDLTQMKSTSSEDSADENGNDTSEEEDLAVTANQKKTKKRTVASDDERPSKERKEEGGDTEDEDEKEAKKRKGKERKHRKKDIPQEEDDGDERGSTKSLSQTGVPNISSTPEDHASSRSNEKTRSRLKESTNLPHDDSGVLCISGSTSKASQRRKTKGD